jgi:hypothetical protein
MAGLVACIQPIWNPTQGNLHCFPAVNARFSLKITAGLFASFRIETLTDSSMCLLKQKVLEYRKH